MSNKCLSDIFEVLIHRYPDHPGDILNFVYSPAEADNLAKKIINILGRKGENSINYPYKDCIIQIFPVSASLPLYYDIYVYKI